MATVNTPQPYDSTNILLTKLLRVFGGSPTPFDRINNLIAKIVERVQSSAGIESVTYAASVELDFSTNPDKTIALSGDVAFTSANLAAGESISIRIVADGSTRNLSFPADWTFLGSAAPASIAAGKVAILSLKAYGSADADVVAAYSEEP